jgi:hypothetical protein
MGTAAIALSTTNSIQLTSLRAEIKATANTINEMKARMNQRSAEIFHINEGQQKMSEKLNYTQMALNQMIHLVNQHSDILNTHETAIKKLSEITTYLNHRMTAFIHAIDTYFIHTAIEDILENKLNLKFTHHKDLPKIINMIIRATNVTFDETKSSLSLIDLAARLLVRQNIDFVPSKPKQEESPNILGQLMISSFFAAAKIDPSTFKSYEIVPIPFNHQNHRVQLAQMSSIVGINEDNKQMIRWSKTEATSCKFNTMSSCRETPAIRRNLEDDCIIQILNNGNIRSRTWFG